MSEIKSFKGMSSSEQLVNLEQVVSREKKLMFLVCENSLLLSESEREELRDVLLSSFVFDSQEFNSRYGDRLSSILDYFLDNSETATILAPYRSSVDYFDVSSSRDLALRLLAGEKLLKIEITSNDGIDRTISSVNCRHIGFDESVLEIDFGQKCLKEPYDLLAVSKISRPERQSDDCHIDTPEHQVMVAVHNEFWADDTSPKQTEIIKWISKTFAHHNLGVEKIRYIEKFCRPKNRRMGGKPPRQQWPQKNQL